MSHQNVVSYDQVRTTRVVSYDHVTTTGVVSYDQVTTTRVVNYHHVTTARVISYDHVTTTGVVSYDLVTTLTDDSKLLSPSFHGLQEVANWHCCAQLESYQFNCSTLTRYIQVLDPEATVAVCPLTVFTSPQFFSITLTPYQPIMGTAETQSAD